LLQREAEGAKTKSRKEGEKGVREIGGRRMSGGRLCTLLGELGFEGWEALDPDSFEWPFQYEDTRPLLHWISSSLRTSNVLSLSELSQLTLSLSLTIVNFIVNY